MNPKFHLVFFLVNLLKLGHGKSNFLFILEKGPRTDHGGVFIFQESSCEPTTSIIVYAPLDVKAANVLFGGGDPEIIQLLPSGFTIIPSGPPLDHPAAAAAICDADLQNGTLLTISLQILVDSNPLANVSDQALDNVNKLLQSTMHNIEVALAPFYL